MKNSTLQLFLLLVTTGFIFSCSPESTGEKRFISEPVALTVGTNENNCERLKIKCPVGVVCDENYSYRAYSFEDDELLFYISFDSQIVDNYSLQSFRDHFGYLNFTIFFPEKATANSKFYYSNRAPVGELEEPSEEGVEFSIDSYENGVIKGIITGTINRITEVITSDAPECRTGDISGICAEYHEADIPFSIEYSFCIE